MLFLGTFSTKVKGKTKSRSAWKGWETELFINLNVSFCVSVSTLFKVMKAYNYSSNSSRKPSQDYDRDDNVFLLHYDTSLICGQLYRL